MPGLVAVAGCLGYSEGCLDQPKPEELHPKVCLLLPNCSIDMGSVGVEAKTEEEEVFAIAAITSDSPGIF